MCQDVLSVLISIAENLALLDVGFRIIKMLANIVFDMYQLCF